MIRDEIIDGHWLPGEKLQPTALAERYGVSTTVVREALTRLAGTGFVTVEPNRGFFAPLLALDRLADETELRCRAEGHAVELAITRGDLAWESELIAVHHTLARTPRRDPANPGRVTDAWEEAHRAFHTKLIEPCRLPVLIGLANYLSHSTELYRRWAAPSPAAGERDVEGEHQQILEAVLARDSTTAAALLRAHYEKTVEVILRSGLIHDVSAAGAGAARAT